MDASAGDPFPLFPPIEPYRSGYLPVDDRHRIYWEECGKSNGQPVVLLHGGPGGSSQPDHRRLFDPSHFRAVLFDQRGAGRSEPSAELADNTTQHLIADVEVLRRHLGIERWIVFGGSWGSTLTLAYAQAHPERCVALVVRGIWLGRPEELRWLLYGMRLFFPEHWRRFAEFIPEAERHDLLNAYNRRLHDPDPAVHMKAANVWKTYEGHCVQLLPNPKADRGESPKTLATARIEAHYILNNLFLEPEQLIRSMGRIRHIPGTIIQGRYDIMCPIINADDLSRAWPEAAYRIIPDAGHSYLEPGIRRALIETMGTLKGLQ